jgi:hypothetical protein
MSHATSRVMSRATCRGTRTRGVGEVVDDEPTRGEVVDNESLSHATSRAMCRSNWMRGIGEVVDDEPGDESRDVPKQLDAWRRKIDSTLTGARLLASMDVGESMSRLILLTRVLRIRPVVMITPTWRASCRCFRPANLPRGTRGSRLCGGDRDRETDNSKVCTRTRDTRFISGLQGGEPYVRFGVSSMAPCAWCWVEIRCPARYSGLLYIVQGTVS